MYIYSLWSENKDKNYKKKEKKNTKSKKYTYIRAL